MHAAIKINNELKAKVQNIALKKLPIAATRQTVYI